MSFNQNGELDYFNLPNEWSVKTVEELVKEKILDKPLDGNHGGIHPTQKDFVNEGIPFIMASDIKNGIIDYINCKYITLETSKGLKKGFAREGDVLLTHKATIGRTAIVQGIMSPYIVLTPQVTYYRILNSHKLDNRYLKYYFMSKGFSELFNAWAQGGSTRAYLGITAQQKLPIIVPSIQEQKAIANILSSLDEKIELNNQMNKTLEEMARALFKRWFVDFEFPNVDGEPYKSSGGEMVDSELGMIPKGWKVQQLNDLCEITSSKRIFMKEYVEDGIPFYRSKEVIEKSKGNAISTELFITHNRYNEIKEKFGVPIKNDILLTSVGTLGVAFLVDEEGFYFKDGNLTWFRNFSNNYFNVYVYLFLLSNIGKQAIDAITIGSTQKALTISALKQIRVVVPNGMYAKQFAELSSILIEQIRSNNKEKEHLISIRDTLLPKLMSGEIRVTDLQN